MNWLASSHQIVSACVLGAWMAGFGLLFLGRRRREIDWLSIGLLGIFVIVMAVDMFFLNRDLSGSQKIWARGWIGLRDQGGSITIGMIEDPLGTTMALLAAIFGLVLLLNRKIVHREQAPERVRAGVLLGVSGVAVAWLALTPWLAILGLGISSLAGVVTLSAEQDAELIAQYGRERTWGFVLSFLGAATLAGGRSALSMERGFSLSSQPLAHGFDVIGAALLVLGLFCFLQPIPFLDWLSRRSRISSASSVIVAQVFSAVASFALLTRFEAELRALGVFEMIQWLALASSILAALSGLAQESWKTALPLWLSAALSFALAALCFAGPAAAMPIFLGAVFSAASLSILMSASESSPRSASTLRWYRPLMLLSMGPGLGLLGFVSTGGFLRTLSLAAEEPSRAAAFGLALTFLFLVQWKCVFSNFSAVFARQTASSEGAQELASWAPFASVSGLLVFSLGLLWTGTFTGGALPHDPDRAFQSWFSVMFAAPAQDLADEPAAAIGQGLFWSVLALSGLISFWLFGRGQDLAVQSLAASPRARVFLQSGYSTQRLGTTLVWGLRSVGASLEYWLNEKLSTTWIPRGLQRGMEFSGDWINRVDKRVYAQEESILRQWIDVPAKALQLIQNGDLQWYLVFAIGTASAILIHFLRS